MCGRNSPAYSEDRFWQAYWHEHTDTSCVLAPSSSSLPSFGLPILSSSLKNCLPIPLQFPGDIFRMTRDPHNWIKRLSHLRWCISPLTTSYQGPPYQTSPAEGFPPHTSLLFLIAPLKVLFESLNPSILFLAQIPLLMPVSITKNNWSTLGQLFQCSIFYCFFSRLNILAFTHFSQVKEDTPHHPGHSLLNDVKLSPRWERLSRSGPITSS